MSGITSGIGLVSGLPTADLISQLMQLERRPITRLESRVAGIQTQRTAWADLAARLLAAKTSATRFRQTGFFKQFKSHSSNADVLTAVAREAASPGTYSFTVHSLVTNHQLVGQGFTDADDTPVGAGSVSIEIGHGKVNPSTTLDQLLGGQGVRRGTIRITDRSGASADVDLTTALTVDDLIERINSQSAISVRAQISGDHLVLRDLNPSGAAGNFTVTDLRGGFTAADLGLAQSVAGDTLTSADLVYLTDSTPLDILNDGNGVRRLVAGHDFRITHQAYFHSFDVSLAADLARNPQTHLAQLNSGNGVRLGVIRITDRSGAAAEVDLTGAQTVQDVLDAINGAGIGISATVGREYFQITDQTQTPAAQAVNLKVEDVSGFSARDLGIAFETDQSSRIGSDVFRITTVGDVIRAINYAPGNVMPGQQVIASLSPDGNGIVLEDQSHLGPLVVEALTLNGVVSGAAQDLGILGEFAAGTTPRRDLIAGPDTVLLTSLNGGRGVATRGTIRFAARDGTTTDLDLSGAQTLQNVIDRINETTASSKVSATVNRAGNGIAIFDHSAGAGALVISDLGESTVAQDLGISGSVAAASINGGNLQLRYVSENTLLTNLNYGSGVRTGRFQITDSAGIVSSINLTANQKSLQDVINLINAGLADVSARINEQGDGLLITDHAGGPGNLTIVDLEGGFAAADLNVAGQAADGEATIDGSYEITVNIDADDTLNEVASKINSATRHVRAGVLNDGSTSGYRLTLASQVGGRRGELVFDVGDTGLSMETLVRAQDAVVFFGGTQGVNPLVITSSSNTLSNVIGGVTIDLVGTSDQPVTLSITQDLDSVVQQIHTFVDDFNGVLDRISRYTSFDAETLERGVLLGDSTLQRVETRLHHAMTRPYQNVPAAFSRLFSVGLTIGGGGRLQFDEERFREAYDQEPESIEQLFGTGETGLGAYLDGVLDELTRTGDGLIARADNLLADREGLLRDRIDALEFLVDKKRIRLEAQFTALEKSLALLQDQQNALTVLSQQQLAALS